MKRQRKSVPIMVRFTPDEARHIREVVKANSGTVSEFVRVCVNNQLAQVGDPKGVELLLAAFETGITEYLNRKAREQESGKPKAKK